MTKKNSNPPTNFWFGFSLGTICAAGAAYLLGTKPGRKLLQKTLDGSENISDKLPFLLKELENHLIEKFGSAEKLTDSTSVEEVMRKIKDKEQAKHKRLFFKSS